jgi:hypothetical protein
MLSHAPKHGAGNPRPSSLSAPRDRLRDGPTMQLSTPRLPPPSKPSNQSVSKQASPSAGTKSPAKQGTPPARQQQQSAAHATGRHAIRRRVPFLAAVHRMDCDQSPSPRSCEAASAEPSWPVCPWQPKHAHLRRDSLPRCRGHLPYPRMSTIPISNLAK